jgi:hypothetical protein
MCENIRQHAKTALGYGLGNEQQTICQFGQPFMHVRFQHGILHTDYTNTQTLYLHIQYFTPNPYVQVT